jgi:DNA-binding transcriptional MerR regulator
VVKPPERTYEINEVAELTGLTPARLRAWERRYEVVRPRRMPNGYRAYTADQVALLRAFARLTESGERIGDLAARPADEVVERAGSRALDGSPQGALLDAVKTFDRDRLEALVAQQIALRGLRAFAQEVVLALAQIVGDLWALGKIPIAAEHLASEVIVHALKGGLRATRGAGPLAVCACLPEERHEWGVLSSLTEVQENGWRAHYLGPDLPIDELIEAAWTLRPQVVGFSSSSPEMLEHNLATLAGLPERLPPGTVPIIGGGGADAHAHLLKTYGFRIGLAGFTGLALGVAAGSPRDGN